jgi:hypothetical protein
MTLTRPEGPLQLISATVDRPKIAGVEPIPGTEGLAAYKAVDPTTGADLPAGREGELVSSGPTAMREFWLSHIRAISCLATLMLTRPVRASNGCVSGRTVRARRFQSLIG